MGRKRLETVGVRQLKAQLSSYLRRVKAGETVQITERGKVVAELAPPPSASGRGEAWDRLVAEGRILPAQKPGGIGKWLASLKRRPKLPKGTTARWLDKDREERF